MPTPPDRPRTIPLRSLFAEHSRHWRDHLYVYPVISRRSDGLSIGVNLNPDKACNFNCIYCQVDRTTPPRVRKVELDILRQELEGMVRVALSGELFAEPPFDRTPASHRCIRDIAFSGDGEPTTSPQFPEAVQAAADIREHYGLDEVKLVLITDAAYLNRPQVREALAVLDDANGEIWAKLDAGTESYYQTINRPNVPLATILKNILEVSHVRPVVIQSLWMEVHGQPPPDAEVDAFAERLRAIQADGGQLKLVQIYTIARQTAEVYARPLTDAQLRAIADRVRRCVNAPIETFV